MSFRGALYDRDFLELPVLVTGTRHRGFETGARWRTCGPIKGSVDVEPSHEFNVVDRWSVPNCFRPFFCHA